MGICAGDYNNNGFMDYYVTNFVADHYPKAASVSDDHGKLESTLWHNNGDGTFRERARDAGLNPLKTGNPDMDEQRDPNGTILFSVQKHENVEWGCNFFDYDNDGYLDLYVVAGNPPGLYDPSINQADILYRNNGDGTFRDVTAIEIPKGSGDGTSSDGEAGGFGSAVADIDNDGDLDLFVANNRFGSSRLYRNDLNTNYNWLKIKLIGTTQRFGIGARIEVKTEKQQIREVSAGGGYLSMDSLIQHFGLGEETLVDEIRVRWPSGRSSIVFHQSVNQTLVIKESCASDITDNIPPAGPTELVVTAAKDGRLDLRWAVSTDNACVLGYRVYRDGSRIDNVPDTSYSDVGLSPDTYCYKVTAFDTAGNESESSREVCATAKPDRTPPSQPDHLVTTIVNPNEVRLDWRAASDHVAVKEYEVYRDGMKLGRSTTPTYTDERLMTDVTYCYAIKALDAVGRRSISSDRLCVKPHDFIAPALPMQLVSTVKGTRIDLKWDPSFDNVGVVKYHIYRNGVLAGETAKSNFRDSDLIPDMTYQYIVFAWDAAGNASLPSETLVVQSGQETKSCVIMAVATGSLLESYIELLREFRDRFLLNTISGQAIVSLYEQFSPPLVWIIEQHESLRVLVRLLLWPFVAMAWFFLEFRLGIAIWIMLILIMGYAWSRRRIIRTRLAIRTH